MFIRLCRRSLLSLVFVSLLPLLTLAESKLTIYTVNYPLTYFTERIGGEYANVVFPAPQDVDPAFWTPSIEIVKEYQQADLIILNGAGYEKWIKKVSLPMLRTVDTSKKFRSDLIHIDSNVTHSHGPGGDHSHGGTAFTTWLDFSLAVQQAETIYKALSRKKPEHKVEFKKNFESLKQDLLDLDDQIKKMSSLIPKLPLIASHPIYQYMARRYDLNLKMVMWEPDTDPGKEEWQHLQVILKNHHAKWMIWEGTPLAKSVERLGKMKIQGLVFSPCFSKPDKGDFLSVMEQNIKNLETAFSSNNL